MIRLLLKYVIFLLSYIIPTGNILVFQSYPDCSDNPYAFFLFLQSNPKYDRYKKIWLQKGYFLKNWWYVVRAKYIISSHNSYGYLRFKQPHKLLNLWHGMPLKKIGYDGDKAIKRRKQYCSMIATSPIFIDCFMSAFNIRREKILLTGQPRNDMLFVKSDFFEKRGLDGFSSVGLWMPTFRKDVNSDRIDSELLSDTPLAHWRMDVLAELNEGLKTNNSLLLLKIHPADILQDVCFEKFSNIIILKKEDILHRDLYPLIGSVDYLITDYSSTFIDFEILDKPMAFIIDDISEYNKNRGFYFDDLTMFLPGRILQSIEDFYDFIKNHKNQKKESSSLLNIYKDNNNCERLAVALGL